MDSATLTRCIYDPSQVLLAQTLTPDAWQKDFLRSHHPQSLLNVCRQGGKSKATAALAIHTALFTPATTTVILSPGQRQSSEIFHKVMEAYNALHRPVKAEYETKLFLELANKSRIICLPGKEDTIRGYSPNLIIIDEASRVPDDLYRAVRPMLTVTKGRLVALSTPFGQRGWWHAEWQSQNPWHRVLVTADTHPRIGPSVLAQELASLGQSWIDQEYLCKFTAMMGLVFPDFDRCFQPIEPFGGNTVGGLDWGWRNPFAAIWGTLDFDDVLWIYGERYLRQTPLHEHAAALPRITWYADPAGRTEIEEFRAAGHVVRRATNPIRPGIAAVAARIRDGRLQIDPARCPNLCAEAKLYRYPDDTERQIYGENPIDENNHALGALRYLISRIDARYIAKLNRAAHVDGPEQLDHQAAPTRSQTIRQWFSEMEDHEWTSQN